MLTWFLFNSGKAKNNAQCWGLAIGADLALVNRSALDRLACGYSRSVMRMLLRDWWSVACREELQFQLECLFERGMNDAFQTIVYAYSEGRVSAIQPMDEATRKRVRFVGERIGQCSSVGHIQAFDLCRVSNLARFGFSAAMLSEVEAWEWIDRASQRIQPIFDSWGEMGENYKLGYDFWNAASFDRDDVFRHRNWLQSAPQSPWTRLPWNTPLMGIV